MDSLALKNHSLFHQFLGSKTPLLFHNPKLDSKENAFKFTCPSPDSASCKTETRVSRRCRKAARGPEVNRTMKHPDNMMERPDGKEVLGASVVPPNALEQQILAELDIDKMNDLAECLFVLNNRRYGPIAGA